MYRPILNDSGVQIGYADGDTAYNVRGKMLYHLEKDGALLRLGDGEVVGELIEAGPALAAVGDCEALFS